MQPVQAVQLLKKLIKSFAGAPHTCGNTYAAYSIDIMSMSYEEDNTCMSYEEEEWSAMPM